MLLVLVLVLVLVVVLAVLVVFVAFTEHSTPDCPCLLLLHLQVLRKTKVGRRGGTQLLRERLKMSLKRREREKMKERKREKRKSEGEKSDTAKERMSE